MAERHTSEGELLASELLVGGWFTALQLMRGDWVPAILSALAGETFLHYRDLSRAASATPGTHGWPGRSGRLHDSTLDKTLKRLVADGLVSRAEDSTAGFSPAVRYGLTAAGRDLVEASHTLAQWSSRHGEVIAFARARRRPTSRDP